MARMPVPVPMSSTAAPGAAARASSRSTRQPSVVPWWPVPNARPGSITTVIRSSALRAGPEAAASSQGGSTRSRRPTSRAGKDCCQALAHASSSSGAISASPARKKPSARSEAQ